MGKIASLFGDIAKSGFVRSVFMRVLSIFLIVTIAIAAVAFFSFASEIRRNVLSERQSQLTAVEETISKRMDEIGSIAYNIGSDPAFYLEPVAENSYAGYEMSSTLARYLVGNSFIEHLAYYRLSEPDTIYISSGERSFTEFFCSSFGMSRDAAEAIIQSIQSSTRTQVRAIDYGGTGHTYFAYVYPLPQLSANPQAFVLMLIPLSQVEPLLQTLLTNSSGQVAVFDASGAEIYRTGGLDETFPLDSYIQSGGEEEEYVSDTGMTYVLQKVVSESNGWTYVSVIRQNDTLSGLANKQLTFIVLVLLLEFVAILAMLICIVVQYRPISNLAEAVVDSSPGGGELDERVLLSNTIATLKDDSEQKQRFETAYHEAEAASRAKSAFLSNMSHDIRTPMNAVIGMTAIAMRHADEPDYVRDCLRKVQVSSQYLLDIINNVLDMSRIESGRFSLSEGAVDLRVLIDGLITLLEPSVEAKSQRLITEIGTLAPAIVLGDSVRLTQICVNILSNSVKFTPEGGELRLCVRQTPSDDAAFGQYVFIFTDNGIGMAPEFVGQVFDTFSRANGSDASRVEGTGLGMAIAKNLVELMGGTIACESELGRGTTFTVTLPLKPAESDGRPEPLAPSAGATAADEDDAILDLTGRRVLLVEDNDLNREIAGTILRETKAEVVEAVNGQEAAAVFAAQPAGYFDLILMDLQMPVMNGYEATAAIRSMARPDAPTIPIYAMTANTFDEDIRQVRDAGMNGHIGKPYTPASLYRVLTQALRD